GTRARGLHALCLAYDLAEPERLRSVDQVGGISCRPQGCRPEQAALHRPSAIRGFRGPADRPSRRHRGRLGFLEVIARFEKRKDGREAVDAAMFGITAVGATPPALA